MRQHRFSLRALQCDERGIDPFDLQPGAQRGQPCEISIPIAGIDHHAHFIAAIDQHQVVFDAALIIEQIRVLLQADRPALEVDRECGFEFALQGGAITIACPNAQLPHVRDIKQASLLAGVQVLGFESGWILDRHVVAGKGAELRTELAVQCVQHNLSDGAHGMGLLLGFEVILVQA